MPGEERGPYPDGSFFPPLTQSQFITSILVHEDSPVVQIVLQTGLFGDKLQVTQLQFVVKYNWTQEGGIEAVAEEESYTTRSIDLYTFQ